MPVTWSQTANSIPISYDSLPYKEGYATFDFSGSGKLSFIIPSGGSITAPRLPSDPGFLIFSIDQNNRIQLDPNPLATNYVPGFVNDTLVGNFGSGNGNSLIFIDQGRELAGQPYANWDFSYLWRMDKVNGVWQATEFAQDLGRQFWHSSSNAIDINGDGILDFSVAALSSAVNVLFLSNKNTGTYSEISLTPYLAQANAGSSALIHLANGHVGVISLPYTPSPPYTDGKFGTIMTLSADGHTVTSSQSIQVRGNDATSALTSHDGYPTIRVLDLNGDGREDFIALAEANDGSSQKAVKLIAFTQDANGQFTYANDQLGIPFTYTLPDQSPANFADWVGNQLFISDSNADGLSDIFVVTQLISTNVMTGQAIRGGVVSQDGKYTQLNIPSNKIVWNTEAQPYNYRYVIPTDINNDGVVDYVLIGDTFDQPKTVSNPFGESYHISFLTSSILPNAVAQNITFTSQDAALRIQGSNFGDTFKLNNKITKLETYAGDDVVTVGGGLCEIDAGAGVDKVILSGDASSHAISNAGQSFVVADRIANRDGTDTLTNVERLHFTDTNVALDVGPTQNAGSVYMIYKAAFNRAPDASGMGYWLAQKDAGSNIVTNIAQGFVNSAEFTAKYGTNPTNATYIDKLYQNVLGRNGDSGGITYWNQELDAGRISKAAALAAFATLPEGASNVASLIANGIPYQEWVG